MRPLLSENGVQIASIEDISAMNLTSLILTLSPWREREVQNILISFSLMEDLLFFHLLIQLF